MRGVNALSGEGASTPGLPERFEPGEIAKTPTAGEDLLVTLDSLPGQPVEVKGWPQRTSPAARGDRCLAVRVAGGEYWFVAWDLPGWS